MIWQTTRFEIDLNRPKLMGIVNVTPDSFSDGGQHGSTTSALAHCERLILEGADILDIGGESSRPGAIALSLEDELARVLPVLQEAVRLGVPVSVDTYKPQVAAHPNCGVCLMHMHQEPKTMQVQPMTGDVVPQVLSFLELVAQDLLGLGIEKSRVLLDPGIGFGKTVEQNFSLLRRQAELLRAGFPLLIGWSRKSSLAGMVSDPAAGQTLTAQERLAPSLAAAVLAAERGASVLRVHDVKETVQALRVLEAIR